MDLQEAACNHKLNMHRELHWMAKLQNKQKIQGRHILYFIG